MLSKTTLHVPDKRRGLTWLSAGTNANQNQLSTEFKPMKRASGSKSRLAWKDLVSSLASRERENNKIRWILWFSIILLSMVAFSTQCYLLFSDYFKYDTAVYMDISLERQVAFPAVTICNKNMIKYSLIAENSEWVAYAGDRVPKGPTGGSQKRGKRQADLKLLPIRTPISVEQAQTTVSESITAKMISKTGRTVLAENMQTATSTTQVQDEFSTDTTAKGIITHGFSHSAEGSSPLNLGFSTPTDVQHIETATFTDEYDRTGEIMSISTPAGDVRTSTNNIDLPTLEHLTGNYNPAIAEPTTTFYIQKPDGAKTDVPTSPEVNQVTDSATSSDSSITLQTGNKLITSHTNPQSVRNLTESSIQQVRFTREGFSTPQVDGSAQPHIEATDRESRGPVELELTTAEAMPSIASSFDLQTETTMQDHFARSPSTSKTRQPSLDSSTGNEVLPTDGGSGPGHGWFTSGFVTPQVDGSAQPHIEATDRESRGPTELELTTAEPMVSIASSVNLQTEATMQDHFARSPSTSKTRQPRLDSSTRNQVLPTDGGSGPGQDQGLEPEPGRQLGPGAGLPISGNIKSCFNSSDDDIDCAVRAFGKNEEFTRRFLLAAGVEQLASEEKIRLSYNISEMLVSCSWFGQECNSTDFRHIWVPGAGSCYTFNHDPHNTLVARAVGPQYGLTLILFAQTETYLPLISESYGFRVTIHSPIEAVLPNENGFDIPSKQETSISLRATDIKRMEPPYVTRCYNDTKAPEPFKNAYREWFPESEYTPHVCLQTCLQRSFMERCGCADPFLPSTGQAFTNIEKVQNGEMAYCEYMDETDRNCINLVRSEMSETGLDCSCPPKCEEMIYTITSSASLWPTKDYQHHLIPKLNDMLNDLENTVFHESDVAKLNIYFEDLIVQKIHHSPAYEWPMLVSDLGGLLGLWLGLSILALYEFLEVITIKLKTILPGCKK